MIVVEVLMISCQVSEKASTGPEKPQTAIKAMQRMNVIGRPAPRATALAIFTNHFSIQRHGPITINPAEAEVFCFIAPSLLPSRRFGLTRFTFEVEFFEGAVIAGAAPAFLAALAFALDGFSAAAFLGAAFLAGAFSTASLLDEKTPVIRSMMDTALPSVQLDHQCAAAGNGSIQGSAIANGTTPTVGLKSTHRATFYTDFAQD
ncbi:hypothetical protein LB524_16445 [Mesorhizobium sp. ESP6-5]|uniref:hypothetical protein n=1 Tax=Mesorhizobium sp. ESP6-5 TaxID=2876623 RepID=UPI001CCF5DA0|nr:hypothetical protein [Mesorhizobium sp. ESP6-5]MBZ9756883.1 hypothetical protein [Mesorhizobium sp. ESP6-5]